jgi:hypothetical protein
MKVRDYIAALSSFDPELDIVILHDEFAEYMNAGGPRITDVAQRR